MKILAVNNYNKSSSISSYNNNRYSTTNQTNTNSETSSIAFSGQMSTEAKPTSKMAKKALLAIASTLLVFFPIQKIFAESDPTDSITSPVLKSMINGAKAGRASGQVLVDLNNSFWNSLDGRTRELAFNLETKEAQYFVENGGMLPNEYSAKITENIGGTEKEIKTVELLMKRYTLGEQSLGIPFVFRLSPERQKIWTSVDYNAGMYAMNTGRLVNLSKKNIDTLMAMDKNTTEEDWAIYAIALFATNKIIASTSPFGFPQGDLPTVGQTKSLKDIFQ